TQFLNTTRRVSQLFDVNLHLLVEFAIAELEERAQRGEIIPEELEKLTQELRSKIAEIDAKIADKI
ncbi:MAG: hypothetical protein J1E57_12555, partial [Prevotella sp.]|nr:hypothetical protein [Prevotella sp.]